MRKEFKNAIKDYIGELKHKMCIRHYIVTTWENERTELTYAGVELGRARAAAKQWDGQLWEIIPNDGETGATARARG